MKFLRTDLTARLTAKQTRRLANTVFFAAVAILALLFLLGSVGPVVALLLCVIASTVATVGMRLFLDALAKTAAEQAESGASIPTSSTALEV